jgi:hypothetical protein
VPRVGILSPAASETAATLTAFREARRLEFSVCAPNTLRPVEGYRKPTFCFVFRLPPEAESNLPLESPQHIGKGLSFFVGQLFAAPARRPAQSSLETVWIADPYGLSQKTDSPLPLPQIFSGIRFEGRMEMYAESRGAPRLKISPARVS